MRLKGYFNDSKPFIKVRFKGCRRAMEFLIDTGFSGYLAVPQNMVRKMMLKRMGEGKFMTVRGKYTVIKLYIGFIHWFGRIERVTVLATKGIHCLIGMQLLHDCKLAMQPSKGYVLLSRSLRKTGAEGL